MRPAAVLGTLILSWGSHCTGTRSRIHAHVLSWSWRRAALHAFQNHQRSEAPQVKKKKDHLLGAQIPTPSNDPILQPPRLRPTSFCSDRRLIGTASIPQLQLVPLHYGLPRKFRYPTQSAIERKTPELRPRPQHLPSSSHCLGSTILHCELTDHRPIRDRVLLHHHPVSRFRAITPPPWRRRAQLPTLHQPQSTTHVVP